MMACDDLRDGIVAQAQPSKRFFQWPDGLFHGTSVRAQRCNDHVIAGCGCSRVIQLFHTHPERRPAPPISAVQVRTPGRKSLDQRKLVG